MEHDSDKAQLLPNALLAVLQALVEGAVLFFLYRYILRVLGIEAIGLWSLILATTSMMRVSELGLSGSSVRYVSKHLALDDQQKATDALQTAIISVAVLFIIMALLILPFASWLLSLVLERQSLEEGLRLLPYGLASLWISGVASAVQSGLVGCHRSDLRSVSTIFSNLVFIGLGFILVPVYGIFGLAMAQIARGAVVFLLSWILVRRILTSLSLSPYRWSRSSFLEMWRYGANFQLITIMSMLADPITKGLLVSLGSLSAAGYYDMAFRVVTIVRGLITNALQVTVPYYSKMSELKNLDSKKFFIENFRITALVSYPIMIGLASIAKTISVIWIGTENMEFIFYVLLLSAGLGINLLSTPGYFLNAGSEGIKYNTIGHFIELASTVILCSLFGTFLGVTGVVLGRALAYVISGIYIICPYLLAINAQVARPLFKELVSGLIVSLFVGVIVAMFEYDSKQIFLILISQLSLLSILFGFSTRSIWYHRGMIALPGLKKW